MAMTPAARRRRFFTLSTALVVSVLAAAVAAVAIGSAYRARIDLTATRRHALSERTMGILRSLESPYEVVVVADQRTVSEQARTAVGDVLEEFDRRSSNVRVTSINAGAAGDQAQLTDTLNRLAAIYADELTRHADAARASIETARALANSATRASQSLQALASELDPTDNLRGGAENQAAALRLRSDELSQMADRAQEEMNERLLGVDIPAADDAVSILLSPIERTRDETAELVRRLEQIAASIEGDEQATQAARDAAAAVAAMRDEAARAADRLSRLGSSQLLAMVRAMQRDNVVLVVSETGATAVSFAALFPTSAAAQEAGVGEGELRFIGEELLATAIGALANPNRPIVVLTHVWPVRLLDEAGGARSTEGPLAIAGLVDHLRLRGVDAAEWSLAETETRPDLSEMNPSGERPVVWAILGSVATAPDAARLNARLADATEALIDDGERLLVSLSPSTLPGAGAEDIVAAPLEAFGLSPDTGRPLIRRVRGPQDDRYDPGFTLTNANEAHPIGGAIDGLVTRLGWVTPIGLPEEAPAGVQRWPVLSVPDRDDVWAESQWIELWSTPQSARPRMSNPPRLDEGLDDPTGPWTVVAAAQRPAPGESGATQRLVAVGATGWFLDVSTQRLVRVDGRTANRYPGNLELLDASVAWLAGLDHLIAPSAQARDVPRVGSMTPAQLSTLRWSLIAGPPVIVLLIGGAVRLLRG